MAFLIDECNVIFQYFKREDSHGNIENVKFFLNA